MSAVLLEGGGHAADGAGGGGERRQTFLQILSYAVYYHAVGSNRGPQSLKLKYLYENVYKNSQLSAFI